jgi:hypothetical protein
MWIKLSQVDGFLRSVELKHSVRPAFILLSLVQPIQITQLQ